LDFMRVFAVKFNLVIPFEIEPFYKRVDKWHIDLFKITAQS
jgi:hypothetical protein